jgi:glycosyltransferase involved in cell wall biosynthesis
MKSVLVCAVQAPFVEGGAEILTRELAESLKRRGLRVDVASVPFKWYPVSELLRQALAWRLLDVTEANGIPVDLVIPTKFPSFLVRHPNKVAWLYHQHREAYDLHGTSFGSFSEHPEDQAVRAAIQRMDSAALGECRRLFAISKNVAARLLRYNGLEAEALYPPPQHQGRYRSGEPGDYLFYAGRLDRLKRLDLVIDAVSHAGAPVRLKIAGSGPLEAELRKQIARLGVEDRVELLGFVSSDELIALYAGCRAAVYCPLNEDYGYVTVEAFLSRKPVLTCDDAGGPLEFVAHARSGVVTPAEAQALAEGMRRLYEMSPQQLHAMGAEGHETVKDIHWEHVLDRLTETLR